VPNPAFGLAGEPKNIQRDFGFGGTQGTGNVTLNGVTLPVVSWTNDLLVVRVPPNAATGQLAVNRGNGLSTLVGVTVTVGGAPPRYVAPGGKIQDAIDAALAGDLILIPPGTYNELVIMSKKVKLQGWGAPSTVINAAKTPSEKLHLWRVKVGQLALAGAFDLLPGQELVFDAPNNEPTLFTTDEGPGILVVGKVGAGANAFTQGPNHARIDGITVTGADNGGAIFASGYANYLEISNNKLIGNYGVYGGGIRIGHPVLVNPDVPGGLYGGYTDNNNRNVNIHHNHVTQNGTSAPTSAGGGIAMCNGASSYSITRNYVCGNFSAGSGGGIGHKGLSISAALVLDPSVIADNKVIFNQSFNQGTPQTGGGIFVGGQAAIAVGGLTPGAGWIRIERNWIQGNQAGAGDGGGISLQGVNGADVARLPNFPLLWFSATVQNNMIVNNMAGLAGAGLAMQDTIVPDITNNTIANNDSTGTAGLAFMPGSPNQSTPQPAGVVSRAYTTLLYNTIGQGSGFKKEFADPADGNGWFVNNIIWHNRSFYWTTDPATIPQYHLVPNIGAGQPAVYSDLAVLGTTHQGTFPLFAEANADKMSPTYSILTNVSGYPGTVGTAVTNKQLDPMFVAEYFNGSQGQTIQMPELTTSIATAPAFDEGGNFLDVRFGPLTLRKIPCPTTPPGVSCLYGDYHIRAGSPALASGIFIPIITPTTDFDGQNRPIPILPLRPDIGADER
jgi:hypothetical protein